MKLLVTGGAGFVGSNFVRYVLSKQPDWDLTIFDDLSTGRLDNLHGFDINFVQASVADETAVNHAAKQADAIVHLGALGSVPRSIKNPTASHIANLTGTLNVLEAARRNDSYVVFSSSSSVYGANTKLPKSEFDWTRPMSPYAVTKLGAEGYVLAYQYAYGLPSLAFRFFNVYGPKQAADHAYAAVIPRFISAALDNNPVEVHGDGLQARDFTYVDTVCAALYEAVRTRTTATDPVNLAFGTSTTLLDLIAKLRFILGVNFPIHHVEPRPGDVRASQSDGKRMQTLFPSVSPFPLDEGLKRTVDWFRGIEV